MAARPATARAAAKRRGGSLGRALLLLLVELTPTVTAAAMVQQLEQWQQESCGLH
jgi:hypothetical protein